MGKQIIIILLLVWVANDLIAQQNTLWLTNGKKLTIGDYKIKDDMNGDTLLLYKNHKGKDKHKFLDEVFSLTDKSGIEKVYYHTNMEIGEVLTINQMRSYVNGRYDGANTKISPFVGISAAVVGVAGAFIPNPEISTSNANIELPIGVLIPASHAVMAGSFSTPDKVLNEKFPGKLNDEYYIMGADESLRKKRVKHSLLLGLGGFIAGSIVIMSIN